MRLKQRSSVLLPQPDGPMSAVILCSAICDGDVVERAELRRSRR